MVRPSARRTASVRGASAARRSLGPPPRVRSLRAAVLVWYGSSGRSLRFRASTDPYGVLVSEVMLQQTQVARVEPAWDAFLARFPTVEALAAAAPGDVLRAWQGLGYNRRAVALQRAAAAIVGSGVFPRTVDGLRALPGVGSYTARAVAAIAFGVPVAPVDTNVRRVLLRLAGRRYAAEADLQRGADALLPRDEPGRWAHAMMDLGATVCLPRAPSCDACPIVAWCRTGRRLRAAPNFGPADGRAAASRTPFPSTTRWLRGRIVDRLRDATGGEWVSLPASLGSHDASAIDRAVAGLVRDGLIERHPEGGALARLPLGR